MKELNLTRREEKILRWIVFREPMGRFNKFAYRPLKGWIGILIIVVVLLVYGIFLYLLAMPETITVPESVTSFARAFEKLLLPLAIIVFSFQLWIRHSIIGKLYRALTEGTSAPRDGEPSKGPSAGLQGAT